MDEAAYRQALRSTEPRPCIFGKALLAQCCSCAWAEQHLLAEREHIACRDTSAHAACLTFHELLLHNAAFTLKHIHDEDPLTHAQEMKLQCGGLRGLQQALDDGSQQTIEVSALLAAAQAHYGGLAALPYSRIMQGVAAYQLRKRHEGG